MPVVRADQKITLVIGENEYEIAVVGEGDVAPNYFVEDGVSLDHLREGHVDWDEKCSSCTNPNLKQRSHKRNPDGDPEARGSISGDLSGPVPSSFRGNRMLMVVVKKDTKLLFIGVMPSKERRDSTFEPRRRAGGMAVGGASSSGASRATRWTVAGGATCWRLQRYCCGCRWCVGVPGIPAS